MAKMTRESLQAKIEKAEEKVVRTGKTYNATCEELKNLRDKMEAIDNEALVDAFMKSNKTLEEAIAFFESDKKIEEKKPKQAGRGGRRRKASK